MSTTTDQIIAKSSNAKHLFAMGLPIGKQLPKIISLKSENVLILGSG